MKDVRGLDTDEDIEDREECESPKKTELNWELLNIVV